MIRNQRILHILVIFIVIILIFIFRLAYIQLIATNHFSKYDIDLVEASIEQRTHKLVLNTGRGFFTDRNGEPLNAEYYPSLILFPFLRNQQWDVSEVAEIINVDEAEILKAINKSKEPIIFKVDNKPLRLDHEMQKKINKLKIPGVFAQYVQERTENIAPYLIGVTGENADEVKRRYNEQVTSGSISINSEIGVSGMQRAFDPFLISQGESALAYFVDNIERPLFGFDVKYIASANPYHPTEVITTIDKELQTYVTKVLKDVNMKSGGVVILDAKTNDLLSLVSLPTFDVHFPFSEGFKNHVLTAYTPGSIFKIVVAAAAIDMNIIDKYEFFNCNKNLYGDEKEPRQLGNLSFQESFSRSCNYTFSYLANELIKIDDQILNKYARKLGLVNKVGWSGDIFRLEKVEHFPEEEQGSIINDEQDIGDYNAIAQTAIGQKNVRLTPLAVANMLATIARGGEKKQVRGASKIKYENGTTVVQFSQQKGNNEERISPYTAMRLQELLRSVVKMDNGTAHQFLDSSPYPIAGKTGTAEKGGIKEATSHWFAGYFPSDKPQYVMVIIDLQHQSGDYKTMKAYKEIVQFLYRRNQ